MSSRFLPAFIANASYVVADLMPAVQARTVSFRDILEFCRQYRRRGIARFLESGDTGLLMQDLQRSGAAFAAYLEWADGQSRIASKANAFYDAIASGDAQAAAKIGRLTATTPSPDYEYEDDFLYIRFLMGRFFLNANAAELSASAQRYESVLAGIDDPRYEICQSFLGLRPEQFEAGFEELLSQREERYAAGIDAEEIIEEDWATEGQIFVEGMALLRLARSVAFPVQKEYLFIPSLAFRRASISYASSTWTEP